MIDISRMRTLGEFIEAIGEEWQGRPAVKFRPRFRALTWSYSELRSAAHAAAVRLGERGVKAGDTIIILAPNSPNWVAGFFGVQLLGAIAVPLSFQSPKEFIEKIIREIDAKILLSSQRVIPRPEVSIPVELLEEFALPLPSLPEDGFVPLSNEEAIAEIIYTSGTTGDPKGVMLSHRNILSNVAAGLSVLHLSSSARFLSILPLSHMFEQVAGLFAPLASGCRITYAASINPNHIRMSLQEDKISWMLAVPEFLRLALAGIEREAARAGKERILGVLFRAAPFIPFLRLRRLLFSPVLKKFGPSLRTIGCGGAALDPEVGRKWETMGITILQGYGTTEASPVISMNKPRDRKITSCGRVIPGVSVKLAEDGEILVKGPNVTQGYFKKPEKTAAVFDTEGWYHTDDIGRFDREGHLYILGRKKYMIATEGGENVHPEDLEFALNQQPRVKEGTVVGVPSGGRIRIHAALLPAEEFKNPEEIIAQVNASLAPWQRIQEWSVWPFPDFPRTVTKKVKKEEVLAFLAAQETKSEALEKKFVPQSPLKTILALIAGKPPQLITDDKKIVADLGFDSLERVQLVAMVAEASGVEFEEAQISPETTVGDLERTLAGRVQKRELHPFKAGPLRPFARVLRVVAQEIILKPLMWYAGKPQIAGSEHFAKLRGPVFFFSNHLSAVDAATIVEALPWRWRAKLAIAAAVDVIYDDPRYQKYEGFLRFLFNIYPFFREGQIKSSLEYTGRLIDRGFSILAFPEGRVSVSGELQPLKPGAGFLAVEMGVPVVPIKLEGTERLVPPGAGISLHKAKTKVTFGKPIVRASNTSALEATLIIETALRQL